MNKLGMLASVLLCLAFVVACENQAVVTPTACPDGARSFAEWRADLAEPNRRVVVISRERQRVVLEIRSPIGERIREVTLIRDRGGKLWTDYARPCA